MHPGKYFFILTALVGLGISDDEKFTVERCPSYRLSEVTDGSKLATHDLEFIATCSDTKQTDKHKWKTSSLNFTDCINNKDTVLTDSEQGGLQPGPFSASCITCGIATTRRPDAGWVVSLRCQCADIDNPEDFHPASIELNSIIDVGDNGIISCMGDGDYVGKVLYGDTTTDPIADAPVATNNVTVFSTNTITNTNTITITSVSTIHDEVDIKTNTVVPLPEHSKAPAAHNKPHLGNQHGKHPDKHHGSHQHGNQHGNHQHGGHPHGKQHGKIKTKTETETETETKWKTKTRNAKAKIKTKTETETETETETVTKTQTVHSGSGKSSGKGKGKGKGKKGKGKGKGKGIPVVNPVGAAANGIEGGVEGGEQAAKDGNGNALGIAAGVAGGMASGVLNGFGIDAHQAKTKTKTKTKTETETTTHTALVNVVVTVVNQAQQPQQLQPPPPPPPQIPATIYTTAPPSVIVSASLLTTVKAILTTITLGPEPPVVEEPRPIGIPQPVGLPQPGEVHHPGVPVVGPHF